MKESHYGKVERTEYIIDKIFCNKCGEEIPIIKNYGKVPHDVFDNHFTGNISFDNHKSKHKGNHIFESFEICIKCYEELINSFIIPVYKL